ncbi:T9SS type A sorting domain-containing protein [bacterium]|nr:T9SS type A sorting domain-containing protein [bacterium]
MKRIQRILATVILIPCSMLAQSGEDSGKIWRIDNVTSIAGHPTTILGTPIVVSTDQGQAVQFNGIDDGLIVDANPVAGADAFTVEVIFQPQASALAENREQRFIHMQESEDHRLLIELRLTDDNQWFLDTFIKDGASSRTLYAEDFTHSIGEWYHAALVYDNGRMMHFVNGKEEMSGEVLYSPMYSGQTSIGVRLNQRSWYKGTIRLVRISHRALSSSEFLVGTAKMDQTGSQPPCFCMLPNYPNPFNQQTVIHYSLSAGDRVLITVFDIIGREVSVLEDQRQYSGEYRRIWETGDLAAGIYICQIRVGQHIRMKQMTLLK